MKFTAKKFKRDVTYEQLKDYVGNWIIESNLSNSITFKTTDYFKELDLTHLITDYLLRTIKAKLNTPEITNQQWVIITAKQMNQVRQKYLDFYYWESNQGFLRNLQNKTDKYKSV